MSKRQRQRQRKVRVQCTSAGAGKAEWMKSILCIALTEWAVALELERGDMHTPALCSPALGRGVRVCVCKLNIKRKRTEAWIGREE